jgi:outer membrane protein TolC
MSYRTVAWALMILTTGAAVLAQTPTPAPSQAPEAPPESKQGVFDSIFKSSKTPQIHGEMPRPDDTLESRVRDGKLQFSESDIVRLALENNLDIQVERYTPYYSLWSIERSKGILNPTISFSTITTRTTEQATSVLEGVDPTKDLQSDYSLSVKKPFDFGLDLEGGFSTTRLRSNIPFYTYDPSFNSGFNFKITQHLLQGFGNVNRGRLLKVSRANYNVSEQDFTVRVADVVKSALDTYWELAFLNQDIHVKEESLNLAQMVLEQNKAELDAGTMPPLEVARAEAEVATRKEQLVSARSTKRTTENQLKKLISSRLDPGVVVAEIVPTSNASVSARAPVDLTQAINKALEQAPEIRRSQADLESKKVDVEFTHNQMLPSLDLIAKYSQSGLGGIRIFRDFSNGILNAPIVGTEGGGFGDSLSTMFGAKYLGYVGGLNFKVTVGNDDARAQSAQARVSLAQAEERLRGQRQSIALQVRDAAERIENDRARIESAEATVRYNEQRLAGEQEKVAQGEGTSRFVLEAQRDLEDAKTRLVRARADIIKSQIAFDRVVGDLLPGKGVEVKQAMPLQQ